MTWVQNGERLIGNLAPILGTTIGATLGMPGLGKTAGEAVKSGLNSLANEQQGAEVRRQIDNFNPQTTGYTNEQAQNNNIRAGQNAKDVSNLSNIDNVKDTAMELMRQNPGLDPVRAAKLSQDMADTAARSQQQSLQSQQSFNNVVDNANANLSTGRDLVRQGVDIAARNVADQLNSLQAARNNNTNLLLGARTGGIR